jgi:hypothetical protein
MLGMVIVALDTPTERLTPVPDETDEEAPGARAVVARTCPPARTDETRVPMFSGATELSGVRSGRLGLIGTVIL